jgi:type IV pilus assembly protein PilW
MDVPAMSCASMSRGLSLIEILVALALGLLVSAGFLTAFLAGAGAYRAQTQLARLQEEARFALTTIATDLRAANGAYCNGSGGQAIRGQDGLYLDGLRSPTVYANDLNSNVRLPLNKTVWGVSGYPVKPDARYAMPSFLFMRGHDCKLGNCLPASVPDGIPPMGLKENGRVKGTDVLIMRYLRGDGWALAENGGIVPDGTGQLAKVTFAPGTGEPEADYLESGNLVMLANCSSSQVFAATRTQTTVVPNPGGNLGAPLAPRPGAGLRLFNFSKDFRTVGYFVKLTSSEEIRANPPVGALMRCTPDCQEVARGIERLDFRYAIEDAGGGTRYLAADEVDTRAGGAIVCPRGPPDAPTPDTGCLWRAIKSIEVNLVVSGQRPAYSLSPTELAFPYVVDGIALPAHPDDRGPKGIRPALQGFPVPVLRREFAILVSLRNYNP